MSMLTAIIMIDAVAGLYSDDPMQMALQFVNTSRSRRNTSGTKVYSLRQEFYWPNASSVDASYISRESIAALSKDLNADTSCRPYIEFLTKVNYKFTPEANEKYMSFYGTLHNQYHGRDDFIELKKNEKNSATNAKILVAINGKSSGFKDLLLGWMGHFVFSITGLFLIYITFISTGR